MCMHMTKGLSFDLGGGGRRRRRTAPAFPPDPDPTGRNDGHRPTHPNNKPTHSCWTRWRRFWRRARDSWWTTTPASSSPSGSCRALFFIIIILQVYIHGLWRRSPLCPSVGPSRAWARGIDQSIVFSRSIHMPTHMHHKNTPDTVSLTLHPFAPPPTRTQQVVRPGAGGARRQRHALRPPRRAVRHFFGGLMCMDGCDVFICVCVCV